MPLLAHSARPKAGIPAQAYSNHVRAVSTRAHLSAQALAKFRNDPTFPSLVELAACWHDLGKVDPENQRVLNSAQRDALPVEHEYAGVRYLRDRRHGSAAALVYAHHRGLPNFSEQLFATPPFENFAEIALARAAQLLDELVTGHLAAFPQSQNPAPAPPGWTVEAKRRSGLAWRFALSCLVDGDHFDTARHYGNETVLEPLASRWEERIHALDDYVRRLANESPAAPERNNLRRAVYEGCRDLVPSHSRYACDSGVGTGKTTAVMAHLLRVANQRNLRHIFVVLPYTNIINQSVETYRQALTLPGEDPLRVVAAHHHQVDFESAELRHLATLWNCPITVTTAVQFFQTMAASRPGSLRKFHELAGSAVFIDEAHAALPAWLWPQTWLWIDELTREWGCHFVFASGSLVRFWEHEDFVKPPAAVPDLLPAAVRSGAESGERNRVRYQRETRRLTLEELTQIVFTQHAVGPYLIVVNTVQTAAQLAQVMRSAGHDVLHMSTALTPRDRDPIIKRIKSRLATPADKNWVLVATSCVEAGLDFSFQAAFRELSSVPSVIQIGGRVNRHGNAARGIVLVFSLDDPRASQNPALKIPMTILESLFASGDMDRLTASELCTKALRMELNEAAQQGLALIQDLEHKKNFPEVSAKYRVIEDETFTVLVDPTLSAFEQGRKLAPADIVAGSVKLRKHALKNFAARPLAGKEDLFAWTLAYDPAFLGYMRGVLESNAVVAGDFTNA
jgi:CRISPR-associated endonuclease/helicase Cas3